MRDVGGVGDGGGVRGGPPMGGVRRHFSRELRWKRSSRIDIRLITLRSKKCGVFSPDQSRWLYRNSFQSVGDGE